MSLAPFSLSPDLKALREEGYSLQIRGGLLVMRDVPYVNSMRQVRRATLYSSLNMSGNVAGRPDTHVVHFDGEFPCGADGVPIQGIFHASMPMNLGHGITAKHSFSSKPEGGYLGRVDGFDQDH